MSKGTSAVRVSFHGAAGIVTGSKTLVETDTRRILVDCGLFQGKKEDRLRNWDKPSFDPGKLSAVVLTHAHIDHSGYLPLLVKRGYKGPIYCTPATKELLQLLLPDAAYLQEEDARYANKHGTSKHKPAKPLFDQHDARDALALIETFDPRSPSRIFPDVKIDPSCAGHILGSVSLSLEVANRRLTFSGDIGRYGVPLLPDPEPTELGDLLVCESTYGNRLHSTKDPLDELAEAVNSANAKSGALLIPSFAIGRAQTLLYHLAELERLGRIPELPVFVDSPMAVDATKIYRSFRFDFDDEAQAELRRGNAVLRTRNCTFCRSVQESKRINEISGAHIIISASGMATGGRILHHMARLLPDRSTTMLLVGYQAEGTRGRSIQSGIDKIKIFGRHFSVRAEVATISTLSAHADQAELLRWLKSCTGNPQVVKINHGEPEASKQFAHTLGKTFGWEASPAVLFETIEL